MRIQLYILSHFDELTRFVEDGGQLSIEAPTRLPGTLACLERTITVTTTLTSP